MLLGFGLELLPGTLLGGALWFSPVPSLLLLPLPPLLLMLLLVLELLLLLLLCPLGLNRPGSPLSRPDNCGRDSDGISSIQYWA